MLVDRISCVFQSPSRWGRCCITRPDAAAAASVRFQSPSRWGRCCISMTVPDHADRSSPFQSPSRWGRCCITIALIPLHSEDLRFSPLLDGDGVASSFAPVAGRRGSTFQSPSRWGRCCIEIASVTEAYVPTVSVPFSMGTVLHRAGRARSSQCGVSVSVPFSMGTVLHPTTGTSLSTALSWFQSPSRWGRCCIAGIIAVFARRRLFRFSPLLDRGRCCISPEQPLRPPLLSSFSPLLDGDGVASSSQRRPRVPPASFSPLLDGDGVASATMHDGVDAAGFGFSPLLDGDGVASAFVLSARFKRHVSVPFSMGTVLHRWQNQGPHIGLSIRFSPLLDGDGVASRALTCLTSG